MPPRAENKSDLFITRTALGTSGDTLWVLQTHLLIALYRPEFEILYRLQGKEVQQGRNSCKCPLHFVHAPSR